MCLMYHTFKTFWNEEEIELAEGDFKSSIVVDKKKPVSLVLKVIEKTFLFCGKYD